MGTPSKHEELEKAKYEKAWGHDAYRNYSPAEHLFCDLFRILKPKAGMSITDFGPGTGRASLMFHDLGYDTRLVDIAENCLDKDVAKVLQDKLLVKPLWDGPFKHSDKGWCVDVMEHIPTEHVADTLHSIINSCDEVLFHICLRDDHFGKELDEHLHLTVKPFLWWKNIISQHGEIIECRDLIHNGLYHVSKS